MWVFLNVAIALATGATAMLLLSPRLSQAVWWRAAITPLASIIGSGFLVLGPILDASYGAYAPLVMAALCLGAYLFGAAIRFNIATIDAEQGHRGNLENALETAASWSLAFAYVISVAYYLNLFGAFAVSLTAFNTNVYARLVTTAVFGLILSVGWFRGFKKLEGLEYASVTAKLAIISGLLLGLAAHVCQRAFGSALMLNPPVTTGWNALTLSFGLLITVQGFETSRYLGSHYSASERIRSMRLAQCVSATIYVIYISLLAYAFEPSTYRLTETATIEVMREVAPILPALLVAGALSAQFSAAIADTNGSGGLVAELTNNRVSVRQGYVLLGGMGLVLTWTADVFQIISYASRAFAVYYALQAAIASAVAFGRPAQRPRGILFLMLAAFGAIIAIFGQPAEQ